MKRGRGARRAPGAAGALLLFFAATAGALPPSRTVGDRDLQDLPGGRALLERYLESPTWEVVGRGGLLAYALPAWHSEAERAERAARQSLPRIAAELGVRPAAVLPVWIVVSPGGGGFAREAPTWSAALAQPQRNLIVISGPAMRRTRMSLEETIAHELAHLVLAERIGATGWVPRWFDEGLAMQLSGYGRLTDRLTRLGRGPVRLDELSDAFPQNPLRAQLAYLESAAAVRRLMHVAPLAPLLDGVAAGRDFDVAFAAVYGRSTRAFADEVYAEVERRWRWLQALGGSLTLVGLMTLLLLVGVARQRRRNRRRLREWEAAEAAAEDPAGGAAPADEPPR